MFTLLLALVLAPLSHAGLRERATPASFAAYVRSYPEPQLLQNNDAGFDARLKLLDAAPKGAHARIATFEFINGDAVRRLARHVCLAAERGVTVELLVDSKSGDRPGQDDAFDTTEDSQVVEELYQYMANCGARIGIYNHLESWISVFGMRLPNLFADPRLDGTAVNPFDLLLRVDHLLDRVGAVANSELAREGLRVDVRPLLKTSRNIALEVAQLVSLTATSDDDAEAPDGYESSVRHLTGLYDDLLANPVWDGVPPARLRAALARFVTRVKSDPELSGVYAGIRRYNRVQHRKLFVVENGGDACLIMGGRNLGDAYLTERADSFFDADVLLCRGHGADASRAVDEGIASFENLKADRADNHLRRADDVAVRVLPRNTAYPYHYLEFPAGLAPRHFERTPFPSKLPPERRTLLPERVWRDEAPVLGDTGLGTGRSWRVLRASWDPAADEIHRALLNRISAETKEIYLETAYAELGPDLRAALEAALARGVRVRLVTNSFFVTDGMSKAIRALMANWFEITQRRYSRNFSILLTSYDVGRLTHFKGAAFACQRDSRGDNVRAFILGSHNFHPRSGRSDKENSLSWEEPGACGDLSIEGTVHAREAFYADHSRGGAGPALVSYPDFHAELEAATLARNGRIPDHWISRALRRTFFLEGERGYTLRSEARVKRVLGVAEGGGLSDLLGLLL